MDNQNQYKEAYVASSTSSKFCFIPFYLLGLNPHESTGNTTVIWVCESAGINTAVAPWFDGSGFCLRGVE
jgi:hypothetical protein